MFKYIQKLSIALLFLLVTANTSANADIKVVASIKPIHSLASYLMDGVGKPDLLVLDEPVQGVDFTGEIALYKLIKKITDELNCGILLISHDLHTVMSATDHVVCLNGHVCCSGSPMDVAKNNEYKALFGEQASEILSRYEHRHDHVHTSEGEIKKN